MSYRLCLAALLSAGAVAAPSATAAVVNINGNAFELDQFTGASVTYRSDGSVTFDGKFWDNAVGVDMVTLGELAAGQFGSDPGDQVSLNSTGAAGPDWLQLNYGTGITITAANNQFIVYEITSSSSGVDVEGTSFRVSFNGGAFVNASSAVATHIPATTYPGTGAEDVNQIAFDLLTIGGLSSGDVLTSVRIENLDTGGSTSDPDFIFAGVITPEPGSLALLGLGGLGVLRRRRA
ncbi:MAG: PEP-CTERM sorting domain-containing protein [Phycisphaerales bacterium JB063]